MRSHFDRKDNVSIPLSLPPDHILPLSFSSLSLASRSSPRYFIFFPGTCMSCHSVNHPSTTFFLFPPTFTNLSLSPSSISSSRVLSISFENGLTTEQPIHFFFLIGYEAKNPIQYRSTLSSTQDRNRII